MKPTHRFLSVVLALILILIPDLTDAQSIDEDVYQEMRWRMIGPFRAGRTVGATGVPGRPAEFYIGVNNGGVWKTTDYGGTWKPIFDDQPTGSIGDVAVAPSNPDVVYVGTGEGLHRPDLAVGDGMFKSTDAGQTWKHIGLDDAQQIASISIDPEDEDHVYVGVLGHPYGPNEERGVFETKNGGKSWKRILYVDHHTGAMQVIMQPGNPSVLFADMWSHQEGPWENAAFSGDESNLYKSTDGGKNWRIISGGLPGVAQGLGRIGLDISQSHPDRMYAVVSAREDAGIYRSDDAGESWSIIATQRRLFGRGGDFGEIKINPKDPNNLFVGNIASYTSKDGGKTWSSIKGAPGGDDYHRIWINPDNPSIMLFAADQGATITVNGGATWSSWYNQPTAQLYHVSTDNQFPYHVYGGQQESGAIMVSSRGDGGQISFRDWQGIGADEYAYVAPDPLNPDIVYGGRVVRFNRRTGQTQNIAPEAVRSGKYRILRSMPLHFSPVDPTALYFATNVLFKTTTGGQTWDIISPDLSRVKPELTPSIGDFSTPEMANMARRGVIYALGLSPINKNLIWAGSDDGRVSLSTNDGDTWTDVTPSELGSWEKVSQIDAGHFDEETAYLAINTIRLDDMRPHIYRTHDGGNSWEEITRGLPENGPVNVVREDPVRPGLLYAGTEREVYVSFDDGDHWQSLRLNMPASSVRDVVVHENDLVAGTHGRSIWILDGLAPLRQAAEADESKNLFLFKPDPAIRVRDNMFSDTPLPPEEPTGENPPAGAMIDYYLPSNAKSVTLGIRDSAGAIVRRFSSADLPEQVDSTTLAHPTYWIRPLQRIETRPGMHRFIWDLRYAPPEGASRSFSIAATHRNTPSGPLGPYVLPGTYTVQLIVDGKDTEQSLDVVLDPRVEASSGSVDADITSQIAAQFRSAKACYDGYGRAQQERNNVNQLLDDISALRSKTDDEGIEATSLRIEQAARKYSGIGTPRDPDIVYSAVYKAAPGEETLLGIQQKLLYLMKVIDSADVQPTTEAIWRVSETNQLLSEMTEVWADSRRTLLSGLNNRLRVLDMEPIQ